jgi:Domain of unknown function (DUF5060)/Putative collagen-binding domain of a collagenase
MIAIQAIHQPSDWRDTINRKLLAGFLAILVLFVAFVFFRFASPRQLSASSNSPLPAGETARQLWLSSEEANNSQVQPSPTNKLPSPSALAPLAVPLNTVASRNLEERQVYPVGSPVELAFSGPDSQGMSQQENPFLIQVDVTFSGPDGQEFVVPAFYNGDGSGGGDGNQWKVRFSPDTTGEWSYKTHSSAAQLGGLEGRFQVVASEMCQGEAVTDLPCKGSLDYDGSHYLRFKNGEYWIKGGVDDPENFLGKALGDWQEKKKALDYLASQGVNSIYVITNNIDGDGQDTWPWVGSTPEEAKQNSSRFDNAKLAQWEDFFSYAESKGILLHIVLNDDKAWTGYDYNLYFREMIARFGHHPGIIWNLGEEANEIYSDNEQVRLARTLREMDPYHHPVTVHRKVNWPFIGNPNFDLTSIQAGEGAEDFSAANLSDYNQIVNNHREKSETAGRPIPIMIDETPGIDRVDDTIRRKLRTQVLYPIYLGGGNFELHFRGNFFENGVSSLQMLQPLLEDMRQARAFVETLPFSSMRSCNDLVSGEDISCFGAPGKVYAVYLPRGGKVQVDLFAMSGPVKVTWFNPRSGKTQGATLVEGGREVSFAAPGSEDWVLRLDGSGSAACSFNQLAEFGSTVDVSSRVHPNQMLAFQIFVPVVTWCR